MSNQTQLFAVSVCENPNGYLQQWNEAGLPTYETFFVTFEPTLIEPICSLETRPNVSKVTPQAGNPIFYRFGEARTKAKVGATAYMGPEGFGALMIVRDMEDQYDLRLSAPPSIPELR